MIIRPETAADEQAIRTVHAAAFPTDAEARLVDALRCAGHLLVSLVAEADAAVVGHAAFSPVRVDSAAAGVGLAPVSIVPEQQRRGIAHQLIEQGLSSCTKRGDGFVVVLGDPDYYGRFGFKPARLWGLRDEYEGGDAFQALELRRGAIPSGGGLVRYAAEFARLDDDTSA